MARAGIHKSEVQRARDALMAQGKHPSIDAIRQALGNTGSKTTIQRYLRELEEENGHAAGSEIQVGEAIQDLIQRLAARLQEDAARQLVELRSQSDSQLRQKDEELSRKQAEAAALQAELQRSDAALQAEQHSHGEARQALQTARTANERLTQQLADLGDRLKDNEAHRLSLEEKHKHAREALEHYRQSVKDQREQEQRRHEHQVQQLQMEIRTLSQTAIVKQDELTRVHQELAKTSADLAGVRKALRQAELAGEKLAQANATLQGKVSGLESMGAREAERLNQQLTLNRDLTARLAAIEANAKALEGEQIRLQTALDVQASLLAVLAPPPAEESAANPPS
ncbi:hypothetical protein FNU76_22485 [Chitinimonas arctica]|uniref:KfrA N-terminal DNA-binding domain-containing protein n=1 Tax=Chitinimonas arctica TaxID=2594795 RepID=A0A516SL71_9NEIS|nr:DNA-binding protein [Chitinimonas arctica]QDQ28895.1 hypothetical protein FNU76_22485 [Chitinimonas arctica]